MGPVLVGKPLLDEDDEYQDDKVHRLLRKEVLKDQDRWMTEKAERLRTLHYLLFKNE